MKEITLIGAGLIGHEHLRAVAKLRERGHAVQISNVFDPDQPKLAELAKTHDFAPLGSLDASLDRAADLVIVACPHDSAVPVAVQALRHGLRVLLEKPLGRNEEEAEEISAAAGDNDQLVLGLNYRFMPGVAALVRDFGAGRFGKVISVALKLGHGGRPGDEKSWKLDPIRCGGGALLDPGIHVLDLSRHLLGHDISVRSVTTWSGFWKTGIEEYVSVAAECQGAVINLDVSVVRWRSEFNIQVLGTDGYGTVFGRGGNYGRQIYRRGKRWGWQQAQSQSASEEIVVDDACENSFADELEAVLGLSPVSHPPLVTRDEGRSLMSFYEKIKRQI